MPRKAPAPATALDTAAAAMRVGLAKSTLEKMRVYPHLDGPPFVSINSRIVYLVADLDAWLAARRFRSTRQRDRAQGRSRRRGSSRRDDQNGKGKKQHDEDR